jgi:hypothetical protein
MTQNLSITIAMSIVLLSAPCFAQENFITGYIITAEGDSLAGEIDYRNWEAPPARVSFRNKTQAITSWTPIQLKGFGIKSDHFESGIVEREISPYQDRDLAEDREFKIKIDTVFLQVLINGEKSLYLFKEDITASQFYIRQGERYELLRYKRFVAMKNGTKEVFENNQFRYQLISYLSDCPGLSKELSELKYHAKSLKKIFEKYYSCSKKEISFQRKQTVIHNFGILGGVSFSSVNFSSPLASFTDSKLFLTRGEFETSVGPVGGLSWEIVFPPNLGRWSLYNEWVFTTVSTTGTYETQNTSGDYQMNTMNIGYNLRKFNIMGRYNYRLNHGRIFAVAGVFKGVLTATRNEWTQQASQSGTISQDSGEAFFPQRGFSGITVGTGLEMGRFSFMVRYEKSNTPSDDPNHPAKTNAINAIVGFRLFQVDKNSN